jgi:hypothetical protein
MSLFLFGPSPLSLFPRASWTPPLRACSASAACASCRASLPLLARTARLQGRVAAHVALPHPLLFFSSAPFPLPNEAAPELSSTMAASTLLTSLAIAPSNSLACRATATEPLLGCHLTRVQPRLDTEHLALLPHFTPRPPSINNKPCHVR